MVTGQFFLEGHKISKASKSAEFSKLAMLPTKAHMEKSKINSAKKLPSVGTDSKTS